MQYLDLVELSLPEGNVSRTISLGNCTAPGVGLGKQGQLGYVLDGVRADQYVAIVSIPNPIPIPFPGALDAWGIVSVDLKTGHSHLVPLSKTVLSGGTSISGVGLPKL